MYNGKLVENEDQQKEQPNQNMEPKSRLESKNRKFVQQNGRKVVRVHDRNINIATAQ